MTYYQKRRLEILWPRKRKVYKTRAKELAKELSVERRRLTFARASAGLLEVYWRGV